MNSIQKEREAFEAWLFSTEKFKFRKKNFLFMLDEYGNYEDNPVLQHWETWQAAKAQAVPEGFVLVPKQLSRYDAEVEAENAWDINLKYFKYEYKDMTGLQLAEFKRRWIEHRAMRNQQEYKNFLGIITDSGKEV